MFNCILQYIYSDHYHIGEQSMEFYVMLLKYSDYFLLPRLTSMCTKEIKPFVTIKNVLQVLLIAYSHNAPVLEEYCIYFYCKNEDKIRQSPEYRLFKKYVDFGLMAKLNELFSEYKTENLI